MSFQPPKTQDSEAYAPHRIFCDLLSSIPSPVTPATKKGGNHLPSAGRQPNSYLAVDRPLKQRSTSQERLGGGPKNLESLTATSATNQRDRQRTPPSRGGGRQSATEALLGTRKLPQHKINTGRPFGCCSQRVTFFSTPRLRRESNFQVPAPTRTCHPVGRHSSFLLHPHVAAKVVRGAPLRHLIAVAAVPLVFLRHQYLPSDDHAFCSSHR